VAWDAPLDAAARRRLGMLPDECGSTTNMATALDLVRESFSARYSDPKILIVLGDGEPNRRDPTLAAVHRLEQDGIVTIGLGIGPGTSSLEKYFRCAATEIPSERIVEHVAQVLEQSLLDAKALVG
ncbi:MAG: vWA domain-containing protein, partial [Planctomycetia bacterium]